MFIEKWHQQEEKIDKSSLNTDSSAMFKKAERYIYYSWLGKTRKKLCLQQIYRQLFEAQVKSDAVENLADADMKRICDSIIKEQREKGFDLYHLLYGIQFCCLFIVLLPLVAILAKALFNGFHFEAIGLNLRDLTIFSLVAVITLISSRYDKGKTFANWIEARKLTKNEITWFLIWFVSCIVIINLIEKLIPSNVLNYVLFIYPSFWIIISCIAIFVAIEFYLFVAIRAGEQTFL